MHWRPVAIAALVAIHVWVCEEGPCRPVGSVPCTYCCSYQGLKNFNVWPSLLDAC